MAARGSRYATGPLYRQGTLRFHAHELASRFDHDAEVPHRQNDYRQLFIDNTPRGSYSARVTSVISFDVRVSSPRSAFPLCSSLPKRPARRAQAARELCQGLPNAREVVLPSTGHMFRVTDPSLYGRPFSSFSKTSTVQARRTMGATPA